MNCEIQSLNDLNILWILFGNILKEYLGSEHKINIIISSPKAIFRESLNAKIISAEQFETLLGMVDDRNLTSHTYNEALAQEISERANKYYQIMHDIMQRCIPAK